MYGPAISLHTAPLETNSGFLLASLLTCFIGCPRQETSTHSTMKRWIHILWYPITWYSDIRAIDHAYPLISCWFISTSSKTSGSKQQSLGCFGVWVVLTWVLLSWAALPWDAATIVFLITAGSRLCLWCSCWSYCFNHQAHWGRELFLRR